MNFKELSLENIKDNTIFINDFFNRNRQSYVFFHPHDFSYKGLQNEISLHTKDYYVFIVDNIFEIIGYGMLRGWSEGYEIPSLGILIDINHRGKGFSTLLMNHLHKIAKERNASKIRLTVYKENKNAISLYKKMGYVLSNKNKKELEGIKEL